MDTTNTNDTTIISASVAITSPQGVVHVTAYLSGQTMDTSDPLTKIRIWVSEYGHVAGEHCNVMGGELVPFGKDGEPLGPNHYGFVTDEGVCTQGGWPNDEECDAQPAWLKAREEVLAIINNAALKRGLQDGADAFSQQIGQASLGDEVSLRTEVSAAKARGPWDENQAAAAAINASAASFAGFDDQRGQYYAGYSAGYREARLNWLSQ